MESAAEIGHTRRIKKGQKQKWRGARKFVQAHVHEKPVHVRAQQIGGDQIGQIQGFQLVPRHEFVILVNGGGRGTLL